MDEYSITLTGMINGWKTKMKMPPVLSNGGPRPAITDKRMPIGTRIIITVHGSAEEIEAVRAGVDAGLMPEIWGSKDGKFS
jgi:hypothetical protein